MRLNLFYCFFLFIGSSIYGQKLTVLNTQFDDDRHNFITRKSVSKTDSVQYFVDKGYFNLDNRHYVSSGYRWYYLSCGIQPAAITQYKAEITQIAGVQNYGYGIVVNAFDGSNYVMFTIAANGFYSIAAATNGVLNKISNGWVKSSLVKTGLKATNQLVIERQGDLYSFLLNGVSIKQVNLVGQKFAANMGLTAQGGMHVAMDNIDIQQWLSNNVIQGKIGSGYTPITTYPIAAKPIPTKSNKSELYIIATGTNQYMYGLKDKDGYRLIDPVHNDLDFQNGFIKVGNNKANNFGIFDEQGNVIVPQIMKSIAINRSKQATYFICRADNGIYGLVDQFGKTVLPFVYNYIDQVSEGFVYAKTYSGWGVVDLTGLPIVPFGTLDDADEKRKRSFITTKQFFQGRMIATAKASDGGKEGVLDTKGNWVIMPKYESISRVDTNQSYIVSILDPQNNMRVKYSVIDYAGKNMIPPIYSSISTQGKNYIVADGFSPYGDDFSDLADEDFWDELDEAVEQKKVTQKWGMLSNTGSVIIPIKHQYIASSSDNQIAMVEFEDAAADKNAKLNKGLYDHKGKMLLNLSQYDAYVYDSVKLKTKPKKDYRILYPYYADGLINVGKAGKWGYLDKTGKIVIPFQYDMASAFYNGVALVKKGNDWEYINKAGKKLTEAEANPILGIDYSNKLLPPIRSN